MDPEIVAAVVARREVFIDETDKKTYHRYSGKKTGRGGIVTSDIVAAELTKELKKEVKPGNVRYIGAGPDSVYGMHEIYSPSWKAKAKERRKVAAEAKRKANHINQVRADAESPDNVANRLARQDREIFELRRAINILIGRDNSQDARLDALEGKKIPTPGVLVELETHVDGSDQT